MSKQSANAVVMIRPSRFFPKPETAQDNAFQLEAGIEPAASVAPRALEEFDEAVRQLRDTGITVHVFEDTPAPVKPDAVFPNNWFSTHHDGRIALYPMYTPFAADGHHRKSARELPRERTSPSSGWR